MCFFLFISELKEKMCYFAGASLPGKVTLARGVARVCRFFFFRPIVRFVCVQLFSAPLQQWREFSIFFFFKEKKENVSNFPRTFSAGRRCPHSFFFYLKKEIFLFRPSLWVYFVQLLPAAHLWSEFRYFTQLPPSDLFRFHLYCLSSAFFFSWPSFHVARNRPILVVWFWGEFWFFKVNDITFDASIFLKNGWSCVK